MTNYKNRERKRKSPLQSSSVHASPSMHTLPTEPMQIDLACFQLTSKEKEWCQKYHLLFYCGESGHATLTLFYTNPIKGINLGMESKEARKFWTSTLTSTCIQLPKKIFQLQILINWCVHVAAWQIPIQQVLNDWGAAKNFIDVVEAHSLQIFLQPKGRLDFIKTIDGSSLSSGPRC